MTKRARLRYENCRKVPNCYEPAIAAFGLVFLITKHRIVRKLSKSVVAKVLLQACNSVVSVLY